jgi:FkbM family methyltransferase
MALNNVRNILSLQSPLSSFKLLCVAGSFSRPQLRPLLQSMLRPFVHNEEVMLEYVCGKQYRTMYLRMSELQSDFQCAMELAARDTYDLDADFHPELVIDGGGNIGLFTLRVAALEGSAGKKTQFVIYEPMPHNANQCRRHLELNHVEAKIVNACLGGTRRTLPFYCRGSIDSSFDGTKPYTHIVEMPVHLLQDAIERSPAERLLIKLDIEGMEVEALGAFVPGEKRSVYVVGELHDVSVNQRQLDEIFRTHGWNFHVGPVAGDQAIFHACSPAALPMLRSMAS